MQDKPESDPYRYYLMGFIGGMTGQVPSPDDVLAVARVQGTVCLRALTIGTAHGKRNPEPCSPEQVAMLLAPEKGEDATHDAPTTPRRAAEIFQEIDVARARLAMKDNPFTWVRAYAMGIAEQIARLERLLLPAPAPEAPASDRPAQ